MRHFLNWPSVVALCLLAACSPPAPRDVPASAAGPIDVAAEERAIRDADAQWLKAAQARDAAGEAAVIASDGVLYREHVQPMVGPAAYQTYVTKLYAENPKGKTAWTTNTVLIADAGDIAIQTGEYHGTDGGPNGDREDRGRFVTVWKKVNGEWKVAHDISSTTMPEPTPAKKP